ncbi:MAG: transporter substrate-binding domain-containing protein [Rhodospirillales bacterium]|nr:transporter substrate-binding domain-containing protein [Rhodospirillales bacterium]
MSFSPGLSRAQAQEKTPEDAQQTPSHIIAAVPRTWPPQYDVNKDGNPIGFAIDVMEEVAKRAGLKITYLIKDNFADAVQALKDGEADLIPNSGIVPERLKEFAFTAPVETFVVSLFVRDDTNDIGGVADLPGRKLAVVETNIGLFMFGKRKDIDVQVFRDVRTAIFQLIAGRVDALVYPQPVIRILTQSIGIEDRIKAVGPPLREIRRGIRVMKDNTQLLEILNKAVEGFVGTPAYQRIYSKWYGKPIPYWTERRIVGAMGAMLVVVLIIMAGWRYQTVVRLSQAQRKSEERLRGAVESLQEGFVLFDADDRIVAVNDVYRRINPKAQGLMEQGLRFEDLIRANVKDGRIVEAQGREEAFIKERLEQHRNPGPPILRRHSDGSWHILKETRTPEGGIALTFTDVSDLKRAEQETARSKEVAEVANRSKSEFLANMSHELRTPLNSIIGFSTILKTEEFGPLGHEKYEEYAKDINASGTHLLELISDILDISKIEAGETTVAEETVDPCDLVDASVKMVAERAAARHVVLSRVYPPNCPGLIADPRHIKQIMINLLSNAIKFTPEEGEIVVETALDDEEAFVISVKDTGVGIDKKDIPKTLEPFGQVGDVLTRKEEGTGLGLPLSKSLVELHGGTLDIESEVGKGTTVTVRFPPERTTARSAVKKA